MKLEFIAVLIKFVILIWINIPLSSYDNCIEWFDDCIAIPDGMDCQLPDELRVRSMHSKEHRDDAKVTEDLQHDRSMDTCDRVDRTGLHETGSTGISCEHPRHRRGQQYRHLLRPQRQSYGSQSEFYRFAYGIYECPRVCLRHPCAANRRRDCQGSGS